MVDPDGRGDYYTKKGAWQGTDGKTDDLAYTASGVAKEKNGLVTDAIDCEKLPILNSTLLAFAAVINNESSGNKDESYAIGNVTVNYITQGGSKKDLKTLDDIIFYDNTFAQGATQDNYSDFISLSHEDQNSKYAIGAAINAVCFADKRDGYTDITNGATGWDGKDLVRKFAGGNPHRKYIWSENSKNLLKDYQKKFGDGTVKTANFKYRNKGYQDKATAIIGKSLYQQVQGSRGEHKQGKKIRFK